MVIVGTSRLTHPTLVLTPTCGPTSCRSDWGGAVLRWCARSGPALQGASTRGAEEVVSERTGLQRGAATQRPEEGPASLRCVQAVRRGVQGCAPAGEPAPWIGDEGPAHGDDTQQLGDRSAFPAAHTGAHRDRRFGHCQL